MPAANLSVAASEEAACLWALVSGQWRQPRKPTLSKTSHGFKAASLAASTVRIRRSSVTQSSDLPSFWGLNCRLIHPTPNTRRCVMNLFAGYARIRSLSSVQM